METQKEIFVLTGSGHKGSVKISKTENKNKIKIECNFDFRPSGATLYIVGDEIAQTTLNDNKLTCELPFLSNTIQGCVVRSSSFTMFGGRGNKSEMIAKIEGLKRQKTEQKTTPDKAENTLTFAPESKQNATVKQSDRQGENKQKTAETQSSNLAELLAATNSDSGILKYNGSNFYLAIKPQLDEMFVCYKQEETLNNLVENSSWVHIDAEDGYYVVGVLKDGDVPAYICYGVPSYKENDVPPELKNVCVWLPVEDEKIRGYWVIYQSAVNGEIVK